MHDLNLNISSYTDKTYAHAPIPLLETDLRRATADANKNKFDLGISQSEASFFVLFLMVLWALPMY